MKVVVSGASGLIGTALISALKAAGHDVVQLVRREPSSGDEVRWDPQQGQLDPTALRGVEAAINLSGAGVGSRRWTASYKRTLRESRISTTTLLARTLAELSPRPQVLLSASAVGYYGDTSDRLVDETGAQGRGFLADLVGDWEHAAAPATAAGIRVCYLRSGIVLSEEGGALKRQLPIFKLGLGGRLGSGKQYWSWITLDDEIAAVLFLLQEKSVSGPVNLVAPHPVTNREFTRNLASALHRPALAVVPPFALRLALDGFAEESLLTGQRLAPRALSEAGFRFAHPDLPGALEAVLAP